jgi:branched-chain amino acid transport system permease protein
MAQPSQSGLWALKWLLRATPLLALLLPAVLGAYQLTVLTVALVYAVALLSLVVLTGFVGQVSLCQATFMGLGAFLCAALMGHFQLSYWVAAPITIAVVFAAGVVVGLPALRLRGLTLAIVTLSLALLADSFLFQGVGWLTNEGNHWLISRPSLLGVSLDQPGALFRVILIALLVTMLAIVRLRQGRTGKSWYAMRDAEIAAATSGVNIVAMKLLGFGIAAAIAAIAGVLYALVIGSVSPEPFNFVTSIQLLAIAVIAGVRSLPGALAGALFFIILPQFLLQFPPLVPLTSLILGAGLILQLLFAPQGLGGMLDDVQRRLFRSQGRVAVGSPDEREV